MKKILILILGYYFLNGYSPQSQGKNYINYHRSFAEIEELMINEKFQESELRLDTLFSEYQVKFARDYVIAAQISLINDNKVKGLNLSLSAIKMGVKIACLKSIPIFLRILDKEDWDNIENQEGQLRERYLKRVNLKLYEEFHKRYEDEQNAKRSAYYKLTVYSNFKRIREILDEGSFLGENIIGIDNQNLAESISDCGYGNSKVIVTFLHYDYPISEIGEDRLVLEIEKGNLHPREYATMYNFEKNKVSELYRESRKNYSRLPEYNFNFPFGEIIDNLELVNSDRHKFGICKYEVDQKKDEIFQKYGIKLKFDYK